VRTEPIWKWAPGPVAIFAAVCLLGCGDDGAPATDAGGLDAGADAGPAVDGAMAADATSACVELAPGTTVTEDTVFCAGTVETDEDPALRIGANGVTVEMLGTEIVGPGDFGWGIAVEGHDGVTIRGAVVRGFRYGIAAVDAGDLTIEGCRLDDNFTDPVAGWVQDTVQGGGIRLENVDGGRVEGSSFARNWNGIELRGTRGVEVVDNTADHCSNTGATLVDAHDNVIRDNDMSWAIRGEGLAFPDSWYGVDTRDSAGIIVDAGSSGNRIVDNDFTYGGDGVFIRAVIGGCAPDNHVEGNDTSFSPHNAIECWCDGNAFVDNLANDSHYGIWLGGTDRGLVRGNEARRNVVDGISIQIGEDRHSVIEDNVISDNGRVGLLLTGREYQAWHELSHWADRLANSSHILVQRNRFSSNGEADVFATSTRSLVMASNCDASGGTPRVRGMRETDVVEQVGSCGGAEGASPPTAELAPLTAARPGDSVELDASGSSEMGFVWLVQPAGTRFAPSGLPPMIQGGPGDARPTVTFDAPGVYDVDVTVHDERLAALAWRQIAVVPEGMRLGESAADWSHACSAAHGVEAEPGDDACETTVGEDPDGIDGGAVRFESDAAFDFAAVVPATGALSADLSSATHLAFFVRAANPNENGGWQGNVPVVVLEGPGGAIRYAPETEGVLPTDGTEWAWVEIPLAGGGGWTRTADGGSLDEVDRVEIHVDTWGFRPWELSVDALTAY